MSAPALPPTLQEWLESAGLRARLLPRHRPRTYPAPVSICPWVPVTTRCPCTPLTTSSGSLTTSRAWATASSRHTNNRSLPNWRKPERPGLRTAKVRCERAEASNNDGAAPLPGATDCKIPPAKGDAKAADFAALAVNAGTTSRRTGLLMAV
eukprot:257485-Pyramimonas_sp.AAC.1